MTDLLVPAAVAAGSVALTYLFCIRPMRHGHGQGHCAPPREANDEAAQVQELRREVAALRARADGAANGTAGQPGLS